MKISIWVGPAPEPWNPTTALDTGIGGAETAVIYMAIELARLGNTLEVYGDFTTSYQWKDVSWLPYKKYLFGLGDNSQIKCELFISCRDRCALENLLPECRQAWLWMHDSNVGSDHGQCLNSFDKILCVSAWARNEFLKFYPSVLPERVVQTRNGINPELFQVFGLDYLSIKAVPVQAVYSSMPNRGLDRLLDFWPEIQKLSYGITLHVYGGFEVPRMICQAANNTTQLAKLDWLEQRVTSTDGVVFHGRCAQREVAEALLKATLWLYPTAVAETFCIAALEAQVARAYPVVTRLGALEETVQVGCFVDPPNHDPTYQDRYLEAVRKALDMHKVISKIKEPLRKSNMDHFYKYGYKGIDNMGWDGVALQWMSWL